jgi:hypothetical protein
MSMPGFTAEAALLGRSGRYRVSSLYTPASPGRVVPAQNWGSFSREHCTVPGLRQYSAILWNIPWGQSWEQACRTTPATIEGQQFSGATRCVNTGFNMWGQFDVQDATCAAHWGEFRKEHCSRLADCAPNGSSLRNGLRQYSAILWDVPAGQSWEEACSTTPAIIEGQQFSGATRCINTGFNMWGQFDVPDPDCPPERRVSICWRHDSTCRDKVVNACSPSEALGQCPPGASCTPNSFCCRGRRLPGRCLDLTVDNILLCEGWD